ncbi:MAG: hypothetical protein HW383_749 [Candidatus Magasanikbacteria bacterium]|nr:hypothetical protein [Candidatus Magasanikbacteria bacterium]
MSKKYLSRVFARWRVRRKKNFLRRREKILAVKFFGGSGGDRTLDLGLKRPLLYQLSYRPKTRVKSKNLFLLFRASPGRQTFREAKSLQDPNGTERRKSVCTFSSERRRVGKLFAKRKVYKTQASEIKMQTQIAINTLILYRAYFSVKPLTAHSQPVQYQRSNNHGGNNEP